MILKRKIYDKLVEWKRESNGSTALLIGGARRVGKSFVAKAFGENEYKSYLNCSSNGGYRPARLSNYIL